jgi:hypothetical protein
MQDARENFHKVKYTPTLGVQGFYDALLEHAQNMAVSRQLHNTGRVHGRTPPNHDIAMLP